MKGSFHLTFFSLVISCVLFNVDGSTRRPPTGQSTKQPRLPPLGAGGKVCPKVMPGTIGTCEEACSNTKPCLRTQMCCSNGCGHTCQKPVSRPLQVDDRKVCPKVIPGTVGTCVEACSNTKPCTGTQMCCSNGCGHTCQEPVTCPMITCKLGCEYGFQKDNMSGCPTCKCLSKEEICKTISCPKGTECELRQVQCIKAPCPKQPYCKPDDDANEKCGDSLPLINPQTRREYYCGRGSQEKCPKGSTCKVEAGDRWAVCCPDAKSPVGSCEPNRLSPEARMAITAVTMNKTAQPITLLPYLGQIMKSGCFKRFASQFDSNTCSKEDLISAVCNVSRYETMLGFKQCLDSKNICTSIRELFINNSQCVMNRELPSVAAMLAHNNCTLPAEAFLVLPKSIMERSLEKMTKEDILKILNALAMHPHSKKILHLLGCDKLEKIMKIANKKEVLMQQLAQMSQSIQNAANFLPYLPYLPDDTCKMAISSGNGMLLTNYLDVLKNITFAGCGDDDMAFRNMKEMEKEKEDMDSRVPMPDRTTPSSAMPPKMPSEHLAHAIYSVLYMQYDEGKKCDMNCGKIIAKKMIMMFKAKNETVDASNVKKRLGMLGKCVDFKNVDVNREKCGEISSEVLRELATNNKRQLDRISSICKPANMSPTNYTKAALVKRNCSITLAQPSEYRKITKKLLCDVMNKELAECLSKDFVSDAFEKYLRSICKTSTNIQSMTVGRAGFSEQKNLNNKMKEKIAREARGKGMKNKANALDLSAAKNSSVADIASNRGLAKVTSAKNIKDMIKKGNMKLRDFIPKSKELDTSQRKALKKGYLQEIGATVENMTAEQLQGMCPVCKGLSKGEITKVCARIPRECGEILLRNISDDSVSWEGKAADKMRDVIRKMLAAKAGSEIVADRMKELSATDVEEMAISAIRGLDHMEIANATTEVAITICNKLASDANRYCTVNRKLRMRQAKACVKVGVDLSISASLISDLDSAGVTDILQKLTTDFFMKGGARKMAACPYCMQPNLANKVIQKLRAAINYADLANTFDAANHGCWLLYLMKSGISDQAKQYLNQAIVDQITEITKDMECSTSKSLECLQMKFNETVMNQTMALKKQGEMAQADAVQAVNGQVASGRRRRAAQAYTCQTIKDMGSAVVSMFTTDHVAAMDNGEFLDCIATFGKLSNWTSPVQTALLQKTLTVLSVAAACDLQPGDIENLGTIAYGLTPSQIQCMQITGDVIASLGQLYMWSDAQLMELAKRYLQHNNKATAANLNDLDLVLMGSTICGLTSAQIAMISPSTYGTAAKAIGAQLIKAPTTCLKSLAAIAKHTDVYGVVSSWSASAFGDIGVVLGGLTGEELKTVNEDTITGWTLNGIKHIPVAELKKLEASHFDMLSREQAMQISASTRLNLSQGQQEALARAEAGYDGADAEAVYTITVTTRRPVTTGAAGLTVSMSTFIVVMAAVLLS